MQASSSHELYVPPVAVCLELLRLTQEEVQASSSHGLYVPPVVVCLEL